MEGSQIKKIVITGVGVVAIFAAGNYMGKNYTLQRTGVPGKGEPKKIIEETKVFPYQTEVLVDATLQIKKLENLKHELEQESTRHFDANSTKDVEKIVDALYQQVSKESGVKINKTDLKTIVLIANNVHPGDIDMIENFVRPLVVMLNIDVSQATNNFAGATKITDERTPLNLEMIFGDKDDRAFASLFMQKREALLDAIYNGDNTKAEAIMQEFFIMQCKGLVNETPISTERGEIDVTSTSAVARFVSYNIALHTNPVIAGKRPNYTVTYDGVKDLKSNDPESYRIKVVNDILKKENQRAGTVIFEQIRQNLMTNTTAIRDLSVLDKAYISLYNGEALELLTAITQGNQNKVDEIVEKFIILQVNDYVSELPIVTKEGTTNHKGVSPVANSIVREMLLNTNNIIQNLEPDYGKKIINHDFQIGDNNIKMDIDSVANSIEKIGKEKTLQQ
jgi:hypothetical protein